jgi:hypothetical protein
MTPVAVAHSAGEAMTGRTQSWDARTTGDESAASRRVGHVVLASGRRVSVSLGQDFAGLIRLSQDA